MASLRMLKMAQSVLGLWSQCEAGLSLSHSPLSFLIIGLSEQVIDFFCVKPEFIHNACSLLIMRGRVLGFVFIIHVCSKLLPSPSLYHIKNNTTDLCMDHTFCMKQNLGCLNIRSNYLGKCWSRLYLDQCLLSGLACHITNVSFKLMLASRYL